MYGDWEFHGFLSKALAERQLHQDQQQPQDLSTDVAGRGRVGGPQHGPSALWWQSSSPLYSALLDS